MKQSKPGDIKYKKQWIHNSFLVKVYPASNTTPWLTTDNSLLPSCVFNQALEEIYITNMISMEALKAKLGDNDEVIWNQYDGR